MYDRLTRDSVTIITEQGDVLNRQTINNNTGGRVALREATCDEDYAEIMAVWGDAPTVEPPPLPQIPITRESKSKEIAAAAQFAIYAGVDFGGAHYSLTDHDQTNLIALQGAVMAGAPAVPYHADGELCRLYPADEFIPIAQAATAYVTYHTTYCNHLNAWIRRVDDTELEDIYYGAELPPDLAAHMAALLGQ